MVQINVDELDYERVVALHHEDLYRFAFSLTGNSDDAAELTQETFFRLLTKGGQLRDKTKVKTWMFTTLYRIFLGWKRHENRFPHVEIYAIECGLPPLTPNVATTSDLETASNKEKLPPVCRRKYPGAITLPIFAMHRDIGSSVPALERPFLHGTMVLVPALNEAASVAQVVSFWRELGARTVRVVDNGSIDGTDEIARAAGAAVVREARRGYGAAAWRGLQETPDGIEWILFSSADGSDRLTAEELSHWQRHAEEGFELILGDRIAAKNARVQLTPVQRFGNRLACLLILFGWRRRFNDLGSLRLIKRRALDRLNLRDRAFGWNVEMQVRAVEHGLRIIELPVGYYPRMGGHSKISGSLPGALRAGWDIMRMLARLWWATSGQAVPPVTSVD